MKKSVKKRLGNAIAEAQRVRQDCLERGQREYLQEAVAKAEIIADLDTALLALIEEVQKVLVEN